MTGISPTDFVASHLPATSQASPSRPEPVGASSRHDSAVAEPTAAGDHISPQIDNPHLIHNISTQLAATNFINEPLQAFLTPLKLVNPNTPKLGVPRSTMLMAKAFDNQLRKSPMVEYSPNVLKTEHLVRDPDAPNKYTLKNPLDPSKDQIRPSGRYNFITLPARNKIKQSEDKQYIDFLPTNYRILVSKYKGADEAKAHSLLSDRSMAVLDAGMVDLEDGEVKRWDNGSSTYAVPDSSRHLSGFPVGKYQNYKVAYEQLAAEKEAVRIAAEKEAVLEAPQLIGETSDSARADSSK